MDRGRPVAKHRLALVSVELTTDGRCSNVVKSATSRLELQPGHPVLDVARHRGRRRRLPRLDGLRRVTCAVFYAPAQWVASYFQRAAGEKKLPSPCRPRVPRRAPRQLGHRRHRGWSFECLCSRGGVARHEEITWERNAAVAARNCASREYRGRPLRCEVDRDRGSGVFCVTASHIMRRLPLARRPVTARHALRGDRGGLQRARTRARPRATSPRRAARTRRGSRSTVARRAASRPSARSRSRTFSPPAARSTASPTAARSRRTRTSSSRATSTGSLGRTCAFVF